MAAAPQILIIGGASVDSLRAGGQPLVTPGGGALYTAVAARKAGGDVGFFGMRPDPLPELFHLAAREAGWVGPPCRLEDIPHFEIVYDDDGSARLVNAVWGLEDRLDPATLPDELLEAEYIHLAAVHDASVQVKFIERIRGRSKAKISAGTFGYMVHRSPDAVRALMDLCDLFFLNAFEAETVFGSQHPVVRAGQILVVTRGADGADVWQGDHCTRIPVCPSRPVDLTGAGDSVCGGMLAGLAQGMHPVFAARLGAALASITIEGPGMHALLAAEPSEVPQRWTPLVDKRVTVDDEQVEAVARLIRDLEDVQPFDFTGPYFPEPGDPHAVSWFFAAIKHQFGFWMPYNGNWAASTYACWNGQQLKGSDYCFAAWRRVLDDHPEYLSPLGHVSVRYNAFEAIFRDDLGRTPLPVLATHYNLAINYGRDMHQMGWTPETLVAEARLQPRPVRWLLQQLDHLPGYREDPLRKKSMLLVVALGQRPEKFIELSEQSDVAPIIDYHLMRSCFRTGLVRIDDPELDRLVSARRLLSPTDENALRMPCFEAVRQLSRRSGRSIAAIDWFFFGARSRCPEVDAPDCARCAIDAVCAHRVSLFQPVYRTTFY